MRLEDGNLLIVVAQFKPKRAIADYANRWGIETLFGIFKSRGFCLEATHLREVQRVSNTGPADIGPGLGLGQCSMVASGATDSHQVPWAGG